MKPTVIITKDGEVVYKPSNNQEYVVAYLTKTPGVGTGLWVATDLNGIPRRLFYTQKDARSFFLNDIRKNGFEE